MIDLIDRTLLRRLTTRMINYSLVGIATFLLDLTVIYLLQTYTNTSDAHAIIVGFVLGITTNYLLCYYWVYCGTDRSVWLGFAIFAGLAICGSWLIVVSTQWLASTYALPLLLARTCVAALVGIFNFLVNSFFNFRLV